MAKAKKTKKKTKITKNPKKTTKRRGRPPGSGRKKMLGGKMNSEGFLNKSESTSYEKNLSTDDIDSILIKQLKSNRKAKEKAIKDRLRHITHRFKGRGEAHLPGRCRTADNRDRPRRLGETLGRGG